MEGGYIERRGNLCGVVASCRCRSARGSTHLRSTTQCHAGSRSITQGHVAPRRVTQHHAGINSSHSLCLTVIQANITS